MIVDPAARYIDQQQEELVDFIFRFTADRGRAGVMAREVCLQIKDELDSSEDFKVLRTRLFQRAYALNEEAKRPLDRAFFEAYFRKEVTDKQAFPRFYRWELFLLELGLSPALILLLHYRYGFDVDDIEVILGLDPEDLQLMIKHLEARLRKQSKLNLSDLKALPRYGFLSQEEAPHSSLSHLMQGMRTRQAPLWFFSYKVLLVVIVGVSLAVLLWQQPQVRRVWRAVWGEIVRSLPWL